MREHVIETYLVRQVEAVGGLCIKFTSSHNRGVPDRMCVFRTGKIIFVEVKAPGKKPTMLQRKWLNDLQLRGQDAVWTDSMYGVDAVVRRGTALNP